MLQRLDKLISSQGTLSRSRVKALIRDGAVRINGVTAVSPEQRADADVDEITVNGRVLTYSRYVYIMLNKPAGVVSASSDSRAETVIDLVPLELKRRGLFPAGRLDRDTTGFVLITDDGDFAHRILSPSNHIYKTYEARLAVRLGRDAAELVSSGITLSDGTVCMPADVRVLEDTDTPLVQISICEGRYHQIKRMFAAAGNSVTALKRTAMGALELDGSLKEGECRLLSKNEVELIAK